MEQKLNNKITCSNCYHKWQGNNKDSDFYFCHKCGYDNKAKKFNLIKLKDWIKNNQIVVQESLQNNPLIKNILNNLSIKSDDYLASGTYGSVYKYGQHLLLKVTSDIEEAIFAKNIEHKKLERVAEIYSVKKVYDKKSNDRLFIIIVEKLNYLNEDKIEILDKIEDVDSDEERNGKQFLNLDDYFNNLKSRVKSDKINFSWITKIPNKELIWCLTEYRNLMDFLLHNKNLGRDGFKDVHTGNMGLKNGKLAVYDIQVDEFKSWKVNKIKSFKMNEGFRKRIRNYFRFNILKEYKEQEIREYNKHNIQKLYSKNASEIFPIIMGYPDIWLQEVGIETLLKFLQKEDSMNFRLQNGMTSGNPTIFKKDDEKYDSESEIDYLLRQNKIKYTWKEIKNRLIQYFIQGIYRNLPNNKRLETKEDLLNFLNTYKEAFLYGYIEVMANSI